MHYHLKPFLLMMGLERVKEEEEGVVREGPEVEVLELEEDGVEVAQGDVVGEIQGRVHDNIAKLI